MSVLSFFPFPIRVGTDPANVIYKPDAVYACYDFDKIMQGIRNRKNNWSSIVVPAYMFDDFMKVPPEDIAGVYIWILAPVKWHPKEKYMECSLYAYFKNDENMRKPDWYRLANRCIDKETKKVVGDRISHRSTEMSPQAFINLRNRTKAKINPEKDILSKMKARKLRKTDCYRWFLPSAKETLELRNTDFYIRNTSQHHEEDREEQHDNIGIKQRQH